MKEAQQRREQLEEKEVRPMVVLCCCDRVACLGCSKLTVLSLSTPPPPPPPPPKQRKASKAKFFAKTRRGQPVMRHRLDKILDTLQHGG